MTYPTDPPPPPGGGYGHGYGHGYGPYGGAPPPQIKNNLVWAILTTLLCCLPFGIVAIVKAAQVDGKAAVGDYAGAQAAADSARNWSIWSAVSILLFFLGALVLGMISGYLESSSTY